MPVVRRLGPPAIAALLLAAGLTVATPRWVAAASAIEVTTLADTTDDDGACSLREAIGSANGDLAGGAQPGECPAGSGADTITFAGAGTITLASALPDLASDLVIDGGGAVAVDGGGHRIVLSQAGSTVTLRGLTLTGGGAAGGGAVTNGGTMTLERVTITGNTTQGSGGGVLAGASTATTIRDSVISGNSAGVGGGLSAGPGSTVTVTGSAIEGNASTQGGGGVESHGSVALANTTVAGNTAPSGGGILVTAGSLDLRNVTVTGNSATIAGGGLALGSTPVIVVVNSIVAGNDAPANADVDGPIDAMIASIVGGSTAALLDPAGLADNGGPTPTIGLLPTATAAIDKGDAAICAAAPVGAVDQRGVVRPSGAGCDIGAVERDLTDPGPAGTPTPRLRTGVSLKGSRAWVRLTWPAAPDPGGSGVARYLVQRSVDGGAFALLAAPAERRLDVVLARDGTHVFRVAPVDHDGNQGPWVESAPVGTALTQQTYAGITYRRTWKTSTDPVHSGGSVRRAAVRGASAIFLFTGRGIAFVSTTAPNRGKASVLINGRLVATIDLGGAARYRVQAWQRTWSTTATRTIKIVVLGTSGRPRVDVDAFVVLR